MNQYYASIEDEHQEYVDQKRTNDMMKLFDRKRYVANRYGRLQNEKSYSKP